MVKQKICVLASGGDAPGMNACIESIFNNCSSGKATVWASIDGFDGLIDGNFVQLDIQNATGISHQSGCVFRCGRSKRLMTKDGFSRAVKNFKKHGFNCLVVIGGNGSYIGAGRFKTAGVNAIFIPATIDNDIEYTDNALGFSSACEDTVLQIDKLKHTMTTSSRDFVVMVTGRNCNKLAHHIGEATFADIIDMEGHRHTPKQIADVFAANRAMGKTSNFAIYQEKKSDSHFQETVDSAKFVQQIADAAGDNNIRLQTFGYTQRGATPSYWDRYLASAYGVAVMDCATNENFGVAIGFRCGAPFSAELPLAPIPT